MTWDASKRFVFLGSAETRFKLFVMVALFFLISLHLVSAESIDGGINESEYRANIHAFSFQPIQENISGNIATTGARVSAYLDDGSSEETIFNYSNPFDIGYGERAMILDGKLSRAFTPESLNCFLIANNGDLVKRSSEEISLMNNKGSWIWYNNSFYQFVSRKSVYHNESECTSQNYTYFPNMTYESLGRFFLRNITLRLNSYFLAPLVGDKEAAVTIEFFPVGNPIPNNMSFDFKSNGGIHTKEISMTNGRFVFDQRISITNERGFLFPFDKYTSELANIKPNRLDTKELTVNSEDSAFDGAVILTNNKVNLTFKRKLSTIIQTLIVALLSYVGLYNLNRWIRNARRKTFERITLKSCTLTFVLPAMSFILTLYLSWKLRLSLIILPVIALCVYLLRTIYKKQKAFS